MINKMRGMKMKNGHQKWKEATVLMIKVTTAKNMKGQRYVLICPNASYLHVVLQVNTHLSHMHSVTYI